MAKLAHRSLSNRRLITVAALGALLAGLLMIQLPALLSVKASLKTAVLQPCFGADITGGTTPQQPGDGTVTLTAKSFGCTSAEYKFWLVAPGTSTWIAKTGYTSSTTYSWVTAGAKLGVWQIGVWARAVGSTAPYETYSYRTFTLVDFRCTAADVSASPASPAISGTIVTFTGTATGCGNAYFEFWMQSPGSSTWMLKQPYPSSNGPGAEQFTWTSASPGAYRIGVWARQWNSPRSYDSYAQITYWVLG
jgi:hypothetical protein